MTIFFGVITIISAAIGYIILFGGVTAARGAPQEAAAASIALAVAIIPYVIFRAFAWGKDRKEQRAMHEEMMAKIEQKSSISEEQPSPSIQQEQ